MEFCFGSPSQLILCDLQEKKLQNLSKFLKISPFWEDVTLWDELTLVIN